MVSMKKVIGVILFILVIITLLFDRANSQTEPERVKELSSSKNIEFAPAISGDGKSMVFQIMRKNRWYLYESYYQNGVWTDPEPLDELNRKFEYIAGPSLTYNGQSLYFTAFQEDSEQMVNSEDIFVSHKIGGMWSEPENLGKPVNSFMYEGFPSISPDGNTIYFMRDNKDYPFDDDVKVHCFKLFRSKRNIYGKWQKPEELPYPVNFNCERSPKIMIDNKTLMFSSLRADGKGKFDIYSSVLQSNDTWSQPVPVDYLNTKNNDQSPCISADGTTAYFYLDGDIFQVTIPDEQRSFDKITLHGKVIDAVFKLGLSVNVQMVNPYSGQIIQSLDNTESDGKFTVDLMKGLVYHFNIIQDNNYTYTFPLDLSNLGNRKEVKAEFELFSNLNLKLELIDKNNSQPIATDKKVYIKMEKTPREDIYLLKFEVDDYAMASTFFDLKEIRKNPDYTRKIELDPLF